MSLGDVNLACASALVDALVRNGLRRACVSPGSRSTPLALALARHPAIALDVHLDERSSGFFALGIAKASTTPVAVACTSGTAAAELLPAVVEASQSRTPLLLLTADRPPRLRGTGANQTIDQVELFGRFSRAFIEPPVPAGPVDVAAWSEAGRRAMLACAGFPPGPVQINCPFEEPLVPTGEGAVGPRGAAAPSMEDLSAADEVEPEADDVRRSVAEISGKRGVVVAGPSPRPMEGIADLAERLGWPMLAEPTSGLLRPGLALAAGQALIRSEAFPEARRPDVVLQVGASPTSRATRSFAGRAVRLIVVDALHLDPDPDGAAAVRIRCPPDALARRLEAEPIDPAPRSWTEAWRSADDVARKALDRALDENDAPSEPRIARDLAARIPERGALFVGNSMPIRDLDGAMVPRTGLRVLANRGASGIDGLVSTSLGVASANPGPTAALIGDLSFVYDVAALLWYGRRGPDLTIVVFDNGGGAIFDVIGQHGLPADERLRLFTTPHGLDLEAICAAAEVGHERIERIAWFDGALDRAASAGGVRVVVVTIDPERDRESREEVQAAVDSALRALG